MLSDQEKEQLRRKINLADFIGQDVTLKAKRSQTQRGGPELSGPCPICGEGDDRFVVMPHHPSGSGRFYCRGCERAGRQKSGDLFDYIMLTRNVDFGQAVDIAQRYAGQHTPAPAPRVRLVPRAPEEPVQEPPCAKWQVKAAAFVDRCMKELWAESGQAALRWLRERGLQDRTIEEFRLGFNPEPQFDWHPEEWGDIEHRPIGMDRGIVIPGAIGEVLWFVKVRRPHVDKETHQPDLLSRYLGGAVPSHDRTAKYSALRGGKSGVLFGADRLRRRRFLLVVEGELDCMLGFQELGDLIDVCSISGTSGAVGLRGRWFLPLLAYQGILVACDADKPGRAAGEILAQVSRRAHQVETPTGKDVTRFHQAGGDLCAWLQGELTRLGLS